MFASYTGSMFHLYVRRLWIWKCSILKLASCLHSSSKTARPETHSSDQEKKKIKTYESFSMDLTSFYPSLSCSPLQLFSLSICTCTFITLLLGTTEPNQDKIFLASTCRSHGLSHIFFSQKKTPAQKQSLVRKFTVRPDVTVRRKSTAMTILCWFQTFGFAAVVVEH